MVSAGLALSLWSGEVATAFNGMLVLDGPALFFKFLFVVSAGLVILSSADYVRRFQRFQGEYYALILLSATGMMLMAATRELLSIYVSLELTSISLYVLAGFLKDEKSSEAGLKYLLLGAIASAVLLYGMALVFGITGTTSLAAIAERISALSLSGLAGTPALLMGVILIVAGLGFKIASVPFQMWVPDVYEGAPTPVTAYLSVASKAAGFAVLMRVFFTAFGPPLEIGASWGLLLAVLSLLTMTVGNVAAIAQTNIKRMLGYSSISHAGYLIVGVAAMGLGSAADVWSRSSVLFFLASYTFANLGAFTAIIAISNKTGSDEISDFSGMAKRAPVLTLGMSLCLLSLLGLPPTAGLIAKVYIFNAAVHQGLMWLVVAAVINSVISAFYYMRVVRIMWLGTPSSEEKVPSSGALRAALVISCLGVLLLGILPGVFIRLAEAAVKMFAS
ncbi:MAG: NADH-ubiquinone oxidoreductase chain [Dehalococcoidia bacterium]|nr:NADH-ubiquinone oxidoreductase chain [Dehalococcoidia bacterium]